MVNMKTLACLLRVTKKSVQVCRNGSSHLRGNVYVHYKSLESAILAYRSVNGRYFAGKQVFTKNCWSLLSTLYLFIYFIYKVTTF